MTNAMISSEEAQSYQSKGLSPRRRTYEVGMRGLLYLSAGITCLLLLFLIGYILYATETLAGIPSILYARVGMLIFCQVMDLGKTLLAGALTLVIMTLPTIIRTTQESLKTVPQSYREGSLGLGAGKWHMIRTVVLPSSVDGIVTGCILSIGGAHVHRRHGHHPPELFRQLQRPSSVAFSVHR